MKEDLVQFIHQHRENLEIIQAAGTVVGLIGWSSALSWLMLAWLLGKPLRFKAFGFEAWQLQQATASAAKAVRTKIGAADVPRIRSLLAKAFRKRAAHQLEQKSVLWVDDKPNNNVEEVRTLEHLGLSVEQTTSTQDAISTFAQKPSDLVISNMGRAGNPRAGYELLMELRRFSKVPFLIYSGEDKPEYRKEARQRGAQGATNDPRELFRLVISELGRA